MKIIQTIQIGQGQTVHRHKILTYKKRMRQTNRQSHQLMKLMTAKQTIEKIEKGQMVYRSEGISNNLKT